MDEDIILAVSIFGTLAGCTIAVLIGNYVCPRHQLQQLEEDDFV